MFRIETISGNGELELRAHSNTLCHAMQHVLRLERSGYDRNATIVVTDMDDERRCLQIAKKGQALLF